MSDGADSATPLLIFPCNGNGAEAIDCLSRHFRMLAFIDDTPAKQSHTVFGYPVHGRAALREFPVAQLLAVPGGPQSFRSRREVIAGLGQSLHRFATVVHPRATMSPLASVGRNVLVMAGVVVTSDARIGDHVCILPNSVVHHDVVIRDFALIGAGVTIAGRVEIGENAYVGSGTSIMNGIRIGARALVGLGSTVIRDVEPDAVVAGNPARRLR